MRTPQVREIATLDPTAVFSVGETARLLGLTHNGILSRIKAGSIRAGRSGHRYFIPGSEIQKQIQMPGDEKREATRPQGASDAIADNL